MRFLIFFFLLACSGKVQYLSSESEDWCFVSFESQKAFLNYIEVHEKYATRTDNLDSMKLLGCAYYQQGQLLEAEKWLTRAYEKGSEGAAVALTAIYLNEKDLNLASTWNQKIQSDSRYVRWLRVIYGIELYQDSNSILHLSGAYETLKEHVNYEGATSKTSRLLDDIETLLQIEEKCERRDSDCVVFDLNESRQSMSIFSRGSLSLLAPRTPLSWNVSEEASGRSVMATDVELDGSQQAE